MSRNLVAPLTIPELATGQDVMAANRRRLGAFPDVCVAEPATTPPSTSLLALRRGDRSLRITRWHSLPCNTPERLAHNAIDRITA
jgi:hypothetical protein